MYEHPSTPLRPACRVVAPEMFPLEFIGFDQLREMEARTLAAGVKLRVVIFDEEPTLMALILYPITQNGPREEQLQRVYMAAKAGIPVELMLATGGLR